MSLRLRAFGVLLCTLLMAASWAGPALAASRSLDAPRHLADARKEGHYGFCNEPKRPLTLRERELCPLASEVEGCEGFVAACRSHAAASDLRAKDDDAAQRSRDRSSSSAPSVGAALGALAQVLVWLLVLAVVAAIALPLVRALLRARRDKAVADAPKPRSSALLTERAPELPPEAVSDAEAALRQADDHARRGDFGRALSLYLSASLTALDRRGAIRLARYRTNGEYVRSCGEDAARQSLREIVREVDRVEFGKLAPTGEGVALVAARAGSVVRGGPSSPLRPGASMAGLTTMMLCALVVLGCGGGSMRAGTDDPAGDELPVDVLRRSGFDTAYLPTSIGSLPIPGAADVAPIVAIDVARVALEEESTAHLLRWVEKGGVLVLFGPPEHWPSELHASSAGPSDDHVDVVADAVDARGARVGVARALAWAGSEGVAFTGGNSVYAARIARGTGAVVGVAGHELFTNVGIARPANAAAFVALFDIAVAERQLRLLERGIVASAPAEIRIARAEDGIPSPTNPFSALVQAGLGKGAWHALAAAMVLFLAYGIRHARARPTALPARRAFAEHVEATGAFYGRAHALGHALASYGRFAEMRLRERVPRGNDPVQFLAARAKVPHAEAERVWKRATEATAEEPPRGDELATIRDLGAMLAKALEPGG